VQNLKKKWKNAQQKGKTKQFTNSQILPVIKEAYGEARAKEIANSIVAACTTAELRQLMEDQLYITERTYEAALKLEGGDKEQSSSHGEDTADESKSV